MKLHQLRNVIAVVDRGSLRNAAQQLGLAQPAISRSIRELEHELGVTLFERSHAGMKLTPIGALFVDHARGIQAQVQRTLREVEQVRGGRFGTVTVGLSTVAHLVLLPAVLEPFRARFPATRLKIVESLFPAIESEVRSGVVDVFYGAVPRPFSTGALTVEPLFENPRIVLARRGHPLASATSMRELAGASWVSTPVALDIDHEANALFEAAGLPPPKIVVQAATGMSIVATVAHSDLLAPVPEAWTRFMKVSRLVCAIPVRDLPNAPEVCAVRRAAVPLTATAAAFHKLVCRAASDYARTLAS